MSRWWHPDQLQANVARLRQRQAVVTAVRAFFTAQGFDEVETSLLQVTPGLDTHIMGFATEWKPHGSRGQQMYLHTSPEFAMKKLLVGGMEKIFQITKAFRNENTSSYHSPEFSMIEWYRAGGIYEDLMEDCIQLLRKVAEINPERVFAGKNVTSDPFQNWQKISVADAFQKYADIDLLGTAPDPHNPNVNLLRIEAERIGIRTAPDDRWDDIFFRIFDDRIEQHLGFPVPTILYDYPVSMAALSRVKQSDPVVCERFEIYVCKTELANAFGELTDATIQRQRFMEDMDKKQEIYGERYPLDEDFLAALEYGMPESAGIALGIDRLAMLATGAEHINQVLWSPVD